AFWTDDESCKVNVNTASEGTFWDRPWTSSGSTGYETSLAAYMPAQNEFQRYPGHPAMTSLSVIFPPQAGETTGSYNARIYGIIPRIANGGSLSGTSVVNYLTPPIVPDTDRLFSSVDEFLFSATSMVTGTRQANPSGPSGSFSQGDIERTRFFITASSRAPDVNMFNKPRITLWPLQIDPDPSRPGVNTRNAKDKLIAFCSTIGGTGANSTPYYFQRYNTFDYTPGGGNDRGSGSYNPHQTGTMPSSQSPIMDWNLIPRNQALFTYLQTLTSTPIPGLGGSLGGTSGKYNAATRDQILTEMFDFIRSDLNLTSTGIPTSGGATGYSYAPFNPNGGLWTGQFQVAPLTLPADPANNRPYATKGFGQFPTITQGSLIIYRTNVPTVSGTIPANGIMTIDGVAAPGSPFTSGTVLNNYALSSTATGTLVITGSSFTVSEGTPQVSAVLILQPFTPTPGPPPWSANVRFNVLGLDGISVSGTPLNFPSPATNLVTARDAYGNCTSLTGLELFTQYYSDNIKQLGTTTVGSPTEEQVYPLCSGTVTLSGSTLDLTSSKTIQIQIYQGYATSLQPTDLVQTINMTFPTATSLPAPQVYWSLTTTGGTTTISHEGRYTNFANRFGALQTGGYGIQQAYNHNPLPLFATSDLVRSVEARYQGPALGDYRMIAGQQTVPDTYFEGHGLKDTPADGKKYTDTVTTSRIMDSLRIDALSGQTMSGFSEGYYTSFTAHGKLLSMATYYAARGNSPGSSPPYSEKATREPVAPRGLVGGTMSNGALGDWDTGPATRVDGPFINKADLGNVGSNTTTPNGNYDASGFDISSSDAAVIDNGASFSPNRQIASAVAFGSLPSGIDPSNPSGVKPWQTLLFCKNPAAGAIHPGFGVPANSANGIAPPYTTPPDNAFLDFFTMPIVEPYPISEPFSTAGRINMNYQIVPFTYLTRDTGVRAVLKSTRMMAIPTNQGTTYKYDPNSGQQGGAYPVDFRYTISPDEANGTLQGFEQRFATGDIFRSASEICDIFLVPQYVVNTTNPPLGSPVYSGMAAWWLGASQAAGNGFKLTGDNLREEPYGQIYPRLTTKSNTFTVHVQTQSLKKAPNTPANQFIPGQDQVTGEFRGSFIIQRYLDPNSDTLVHADGKTPANENDPDAMVGPYKFRIISTKRFAP
ncbi:MAG: Verru_Chthon cassette protein A, partial [Chthoniobacteraceae bacterium]